MAAGQAHTQWPGSGKPGDPVFDAFYATQFPSLVELSRSSRRSTATPAIALLDKIGPAILLIHSQSGAFVWPIADARPKLVKAIIAVEPNGPPVYETDFKGAPDWFADIGQQQDLRASAMVPLTYDPPLKAGEELAFVRQDKPDAPDLVRCWQQAEPARKLPNLAKVPMLIVVAEASYHAAYDHCTAAYLTQAGVPQHHDPARRRRHPRQRPHDDAGEEQRRDRRRDARLAEEDAAGEDEREARSREQVAAIRVFDAQRRRDARHEPA